MFDNFLQLYADNKETLLFSDGLRPSKSITRNIFSSVDLFKKHYERTDKTVLSVKEVTDEIVKLPDGSGTTVRDHIKNLVDLQFAIYDNNILIYTKNFTNFISKKESLSEYIIRNLSKIESASDLTMFYNYILATLREGILYGYICLYPDSFSNFKLKFPNKSDRAQICNKIFDLYGFKGYDKNPSDGDYTPNINYRVISTCVELGLITKTKKSLEGITRFIITPKGSQLLETIDSNIRDEKTSLLGILKDALISSDIHASDTKLMNDIFDELYIAESEKIQPDENIIITDLPLPLANTISQTNNKFKRDLKKAANVKKIAKFRCEYDNCHITFTKNNTESEYVEAHHLIPMEFQSQFSNSLDVEANIVALCPLCHSQIHYAIFEEKKALISKLFSLRIDRLKKCNIMVSLDELFEMYL